MNQTAKILKFKGKKLETIEEIRAALITLMENIQSGHATISEAVQVQEEVIELMRKVRAQMKSVKAEDKAALKSFFGK